MNDTQLREIRELAYGMSVANLNPQDVEDYMAIASACARMESRRACSRIPVQPTHWMPLPMPPKS